MSRPLSLAPVNGTHLHFQRLGRGPDVVLVHGLAANLAFWYLKAVPALASERRVTVYDLRGHGRSAMPAGGYSPAVMAEDLGALLDHLGIGCVDLVGHSFGGAVALEYTARHPGRVRTLTLADATVYSLQPLDSGHDWSYWDAWRRELDSLGIALPKDLPKVAYGLLEEIADPRWREARQRRHSGEFFVPFGLWNGARRTAERWLQLLRTTAAWKELHEGGLGLEEIRRVDHPTLLIFGERSRWLGTCRLLQDAMPRAETIIVPGAGHFFPLLKPALFLGHLRAFLERVGADRGVPAERRAQQ
ncbi:MAG TPA: alpha/beta hydrolase [Candidatus Polarisedimenticolia bacterium]|nr:alpha/beta hydrolase [Candidatus Polarisedimenticolia bacterium]